MSGESCPPTPPNMDAIHPHRKQWGILSCFRKYTALNNLKKYKLVYEYNPRDIYSVFDFLRFLLRKELSHSEHSTA